MLHWLWALIVGAVIGLIAGAITGKGKSMGWIANILAGLIGSSLGELLLGNWGPQVAGMAIIPSIVGAVILVLMIYDSGALRAHLTAHSILVVGCPVIVCKNGIFLPELELVVGKEALYIRLDTVCNLVLEETERLFSGSSQSVLCIGMSRLEIN